MELDIYRAIMVIVPSMELDIYWPVMLNFPRVELDIYWPATFTVPSMGLDIYRPVMATVSSASPKNRIEHVLICHGSATRYRSETEMQFSYLIYMLASNGHCSQRGARYIFASNGHCPKRGSRYI